MNKFAIVENVQKKILSEEKSIYFVKLNEKQSMFNKFKKKSPPWERGVGSIDQSSCPPESPALKHPSRVAGDWWEYDPPPRPFA